MKIPGEDLSIQEIAASLRRIRRQKGWTLKQVEEISQGRWKAVVVGSYERCDRALSLNKAVSLATFYQVPLDELLGMRTGEERDFGREGFTLKIADLHRHSSESQEIRSLQHFVLYISAKRRDWNGEVLSLRGSDFITLALLLQRDEAILKSWLEENSLILHQR